MADRRILIRRGREADWQTKNPILENGELGFVYEGHATMPRYLIVGDGAYTYGNLLLERIPLGAATTTKHGFMTNTDKTKLDGIESGAQVNPTDTDIFNIVLANDGSGSGLNADLLDGKDYSYFARASVVSAHIGSTGGHPLVTTSANGFMSASDKTKLDQIDLIIDGGLPSSTY